MRFGVAAVVVVTTLWFGPAPQSAPGDLWIGILDYDLTYGKPLPATMRAGLEPVAALVGGTWWTETDESSSGGLGARLEQVPARLPVAW